MARFVDTVMTSLWSEDDAFSYMADARNFAEWDPGTKRVDEVQGNGAGPDAAFDVTAEVGSRSTVLRYEVTDWEPPRRVVLEASKPWMHLRDEIVIDRVRDRHAHHLRRPHHPARPAEGVRQVARQAIPSRRRTRRGWPEGAGAAAPLTGQLACTGRRSQPRTFGVCACLALSQSTSQSVQRCSTSSSATRPSRRASAAPRQKCSP